MQFKKENTLTAVTRNQISVGIFQVNTEKQPFSGILAGPIKSAKRVKNRGHTAAIMVQNVSVLSSFCPSITSFELLS